MEEETKHIREELKELGLRHVKYLFTLKFPEYAWGEFKDNNYTKLDNLWFGKVKDDEFLTKMKAFLRYAKQCKN